MGFLDHSTNNIIVDAVLTDLGRQALSRNDGSFSIYQFTLGDDEVDYDIIQQYGRTVGKEKIEKNTPVLEALTQGSLGLKYPLISVSNEFLTHLSVLTVTATTPLAMNRTSVTTANLTFEIEPKGDNTTIEFDLIDNEFMVEMNNIFLTIQKESPDIIYTDNIATYRYPASTVNNQKITTTIPLVLKGFSQTTFNTYSTSTTGSSVIRTFIKITGVQSGLSKTIEVQIGA
jgi:hypothetical protein